MSLDQKIYKEALRLVKEVGVPFKMDDISNALGISKKTIYKSYSSKEILLKRIIDEARVNITSHQRAVMYDNSLSNSTRLIEMITYIPDEYPIFLYSSIRELKHYYPELLPLLEQLQHDQWGKIEQVLNELTITKQIKPISNDVFRSIYLSSFRLVDSVSNKVDLSKVLSEVADILMNGIKKG